MTRLIVVLMILALGGQWISCGNPGEPSTVVVPDVVYQKLDPDAFISKLSRADTFSLIDLRTPSEYEEGHMKGALNMNFFAPDFEETLRQLNPEIPVFIYSDQGKYSSKAATLFKKAGFLTIIELEGGYEAITL